MSKFRGAGERALRPPRSVGFRAAVSVGLGLLVISALFLTNTRATSEVVGQGLALDRAEAALGANNLALKALAQALLIAEDEVLGVADEDTRNLAIAEADATTAELAQSLAELEAVAGLDKSLATASDRVLAAASEAIAAIEDRRIDDAGAILTGSGLAAFESLRDELHVVRSDFEDALASTGDWANRLSQLVSFLVAFLLPLGAVLAYRFAARRQLRTAEVQLDARLEAEREVIKAKDDFIGNISHELRTPLTSIYGFSELLLESGMVDPESAIDLVTLINQESAELTRMVEDIVASARMESNALVFKNEMVDIEAELTSVVATVPRGDKLIQTDIQGEKCWADPGRLRQIMRNLISNAVRYGGGTIAITSIDDGSYVEIDFADDGDGVPESMVPRLFTRFVHDGQEALVTGSVGLGLSVVESLARSMDGSVEYKRAGGWSHFVVRLPVEPHSTTWRASRPNPTVSAKDGHAA